VEGAVSMVKMALDKLKTEGVVELDEERKAAMVSSLMVVLCADESAQPVVNTGSLYENGLPLRVIASEVKQSRKQASWITLSFHLAMTQSAEKQKGELLN
jgi:hypothetical protein